ncbi:hypothetical protein [Exiguobacterium sp. NG55]|uniref:hypothetical protein n=1 Tax=Exiguobacterium sp. NG55 TaxID=375477 RepID=UPI0004DF31C0|nr:hypothetical protein [Exiguobacterium sp. NG55]
MISDLVIGVLASLLASMLVGGAVMYKFLFIKKRKNSGIEQKNGENQIALNKSKNNTIHIGGDLSEKKARN